MKRTIAAMLLSLIFAIMFNSISIANNNNITFSCLFPRSIDYKFGIKPSISQQKMNKDVQKAYINWLTDYTTEEGAPAGTYRVHMSSAYDYATVSEGIAWGMFITVLMENEQNNTKKYFNGFWKYYKHYMNRYGLMSWKIDKTGKMLFSESATEADENAAMALLYADKIWGSKGEINYLAEAKALINNIFTNEVDHANEILKPGVNWGGTDNMNPAYYSPSYYREWNKQSNNWTILTNKSHQVYEMFYNRYDTGLFPDWCNATGDPTSLSYDFKYDACQVPIKIGMDFLINGKGNKYLDRFSSWVKAKTTNDPSLIVDGYKLNGETIGKYNNASFVGPVTVAAMGTTDQDWLNKCYLRLSNMSTGGPWGYYNDTIRLISLIMVSGNLMSF